MMMTDYTEQSKLSTGIDFRPTNSKATKHDKASCAESFKKN